MSNFIYGTHAVTAFLEKNPEQVDKLYILQTNNPKRSAAIIKLAEKAGARPTYLNKNKMEQKFGDVNHQGVVLETCAAAPQSAALNFDDLLEDMPDKALILILDGVQDPHNLGACLRSAAAAGAHAVIAPKDQSVSMTPTVRKVACGGAEIVPFIQVINLARAMEQLQQAGVWCMGTAGDTDQTIYDIDLSGPMAIVMGAEGTGMRQNTRKHCDYIAKIPMAPNTMESLNVSVAAGVCLFEAVRQRLR